MHQNKSEKQMSRSESPTKYLARREFSPYFQPDIWYHKRLLNWKASHNLEWCLGDSRMTRPCLTIPYFDKRICFHRPLKPSSNLHSRLPSSIHVNFVLFQGQFRFERLEISLGRDGMPMWKFSCPILAHSGHSSPSPLFSVLISLNCSSERVKCGDNANRPFSLKY